MKTLSPGERRALRARAHHLDPVVSIGNQGLTAAVLHELDVNLMAHELVKVRVHSDDRDEREALLQRICAELDAAPVQHLGKVLIVFRERQEQEEAPARARTSSKHAPATPRSAGKKAPRAPASAKSAPTGSVSGRNGPRAAASAKSAPGASPSGRNGARSRVPTKTSPPAPAAKKAPRARRRLA
ncbi:MAG TPA: YhbY family RNA-binding protein [Casimicrobiaceae bacterium]|nr:YhbY family RNA-binding protein [Casimicrobiaceae bacterium]